MISHFARIGRTLIVIVFLALLTGCSSLLPVTAEPLPTAIIDKSPFTDVPCSAPCWHGLVIGKSNASEVRSTLSVLPFINQKTIRYIPQVDVPGLTIDATPPGTLIYADCVRPAQPCLEITIADNILARIDITLNYQISAGETIADLGPPDFVGYHLMGAETITCQVELVWYSKQLVLNSAPVTWETSNPNDECIMVRDTRKTSSGLIISRVSYMPTSWLDGTLANGGSQFFKFSGTIPGK